MKINEFTEALTRKYQPQTLNESLNGKRSRKINEDITNTVIVGEKGTHCYIAKDIDPLDSDTLLTEPYDDANARLFDRYTWEEEVQELLDDFTIGYSLDDFNAYDVFTDRYWGESFKRKKSKRVNESLEAPYDPEYFYYEVYELDEDGDEIDSLEAFDDFNEALEFAKESGLRTHICLIPTIDPDDDPDIREWFEYHCEYEPYEVVWESGVNESFKRPTVKRINEAELGDRGRYDGPRIIQYSVDVYDSSFSKSGLSESDIVDALEESGIQVLGCDYQCSWKNDRDYEKNIQESLKESRGMEEDERAEYQGQKAKDVMYAMSNTDAMNTYEKHKKSSEDGDLSQTYDRLAEIGAMARKHDNRRKNVGESLNEAKKGNLPIRKALQDADIMKTLDKDPEGTFKKAIEVVKNSPEVSDKDKRDFIKYMSSGSRDKKASTLASYFYDVNLASI